MQAYTVLKECSFLSCPFLLYSHLAKDSSESVLLESKDGNGKNNVASMLFIENALRIEGRGNKVFITILTSNGSNALKEVLPKLEEIAHVNANDSGVVLTFEKVNSQNDDTTRIKAVYPMEVLRILSRKWNFGTDEKNKRLILPGIFSYDLIEHFENIPPAQKDNLGFADFIFYLPQVTVLVDHENALARVLIHGYATTSYDEQYKLDVLKADNLIEKIQLLPKSTDSKIPLSDSFSLTDCINSDLSDEEYACLVKKLKEHIVAGDVFQIVPSRTFSVNCPDPLAAYRVLRQLNPSPYLFYICHPEFTLLGSSPETSVKVYGEPLKMSIRPIAGTRRRGYFKDGNLDKDLDGRLEAELKLNEKELAEHMMLVDLARNDVARVSKAGSRYVVKLLEIERYSHVMHLVSNVEGELNDDLDALHAYLASANMGTLVGSPKIEAASLLRKYEIDKRGPYGGAVGYIASDGEMDTAIVIRSALVKNKTAFVRAGAGVVFDSDPTEEALETRAKASAMLKAIALSQENQK